MNETINESSIEGAIVGRGDAPINSLAQDRLGRAPFAEALAAEILGAPVETGYVMGLTGQWGSGKTSILNMTVDALVGDAIVVQFNPWMFSGTEALVSSFFEEVGKQLGNADARLKDLAARLASYGRLLSPLAALVGAGSAVSAAADMLEGLGATPSVLEQRTELCAQLAATDKRLVVVIDDVDRLRPDEVLDMVRLVRLVGDFPHTLYLLAFDRTPVEECLGEGDPERGRAYLEKIVQVTHNVPVARQPDVTGIFLDGLQVLVDRGEHGPLDEADWANIFVFVVRPLLDTPRDVRRLLGSLSMTMRLVGDEVALADLIGMEAIRVLRPAMFEAIVSVSGELTAASLGDPRRGYIAGREPQTSPVAPLYMTDPQAAVDICRWLFPGALRYFENMNYGSEWESIWRRKRKVASSAVLRFYLERQLPDGVVPASAVDTALDLLTNSAALREHLDTLTPDQMLDLLERLTGVIEEIPFDPQKADGDDPARVTLPVLLDAIPRMPIGRGAFDSSGTMTVMRVSLRLLRRITDRERLTRIIWAVLEDTTTLSGRLTLLFLVGDRPHIGSELIDTATAGEMENQLRDQLIETSSDRLAAEINPVGLAELMVETDRGREALVQLAEDDRLMLSFLVTSVGEARSQPLGAAAVKVTEVLGWDRLIDYFGRELMLRRIGDLMQSALDDGLAMSPEEQSALGLAANYATGNRPETAIDRILRTQTMAQETADSPSPIDTELSITSLDIETSNVDPGDEL